MTTHPTKDELSRYQSGEGSANERLEIAQHLGVCDRCAKTLSSEDESGAPLIEQADRKHADREHVRDAVTEGSLPPARRRINASRWLYGAAALLLLAVVGAWLFFAKRAHHEDGALPTPEVQLTPSDSSAPEAPAPQGPALIEKPRIVDTLVRPGNGSGEATFQLRAPIGTVVLEARPQFRWDSTPGATSYDIAIVDVVDGDAVATGATPATHWRPSAPLQRGRTYTWQVTSRTAEGETMSAPAPSAPEALFHVVADLPTLPNDAVERGIALAKLGALDAAEASLQDGAAAGEPRAVALLAEIRAWRQPAAR